METLLIALRWLAWGAVVYVILGALLFLMQRSILYYPTPPVAHSFDDLGLTVGNNESMIKVSVIVANPGQAQALLYFGGNAESVALSAGVFAQTLPQHTVYLMNYPGYGGSSGGPSEAAIMATALALFDRVSADHTRVDLLGRSLGSGVAVQVAAQRPVGKLVLVTPYDSILGLAQKRYPVYPVRWLLKDHFDSGARVGEITAPVLVLGAEYDRVIPPWSTELLVSRFPEGQVTIHWIKGSGHNDLSTAEYYDLILGFLREP